MEIIIYHQEYDQPDLLDNFLGLYFSSRMKYFASDLLEEGLTPTDLSNAVNRAMAAAQTGGLEVRRHFIPFYTQTDKGLVKDCKLSRLGYALVLMNADVKVPIVAKWQLRLAEGVLK